VSQPAPKVEGGGRLVLQNVSPVVAEAVIAIAEFLAPDGKLLAALRSARDDAVAEQSRLAGRSVLRSLHVSKKSLEQSMAAAKDELAKERAAFEPSMAALQKARTELDAGMIWPCTPSPARLRSV